jgi:biotin-dependent carboxylase-like uncharacterized protein
VIILEVLRTGPLAVLQDLGRPGLAHIGVGRSGAADRRSHTLANRLLANPEDSATVEITLGGFAARVLGGAVDVAVSGADPGPAVDGIPFGINSIQHVGDGQVITFGTAATGLRSYLGVRGGIDVAPVLGSRSYDTLSGIGPAPLQPGDIIPVGHPAAAFPGVEQAPIGPIAAGRVDLTVTPGPREDWFTDPEALIRSAWVISERSDRVGVRLIGPPLQHRWPDRQLASEGVTRGAIQIPPNGQPVILGPDHPTTGGYPVIGVVIDADTDKVGQLRPGQPVRLHWNRSGNAHGNGAGLVELES